MHPHRTASPDGARPSASPCSKASCPSCFLYKKEERTSETMQITNEALGFNIEYKRHKRKKDGEIETDDPKTEIWEVEVGASFFFPHTEVW